MKLSFLSSALAVCCLMLSGSIAAADLVITEVMSSSSHLGGTNNGNGDWFELTNTGPSSLNLLNYYWDDNGPMGADGALFPAVDIAAGESILIVDEDSTTNAGEFKANWGLGATVQVLFGNQFSGPDTFSGLGSGGDMIEIWDADPNTSATFNLVASVTFGAATSGVSFEWDTAGTNLDLSVAGENGAFVALFNGATQGTDIGSPGFAVAPIPEPTSLGVLMAAGIGLLFRRRRLV